MHEAEPKGQYVRCLSLFDATMVVVGGIIGAGIFLNPAIVAQRVTTAGLFLACWALGGVVSFIGALCFAELGARRPEAGGGYVYLREAFGPLLGFLYGWKLLLVGATGVMAAIAVTFARYTVDLLGLAPEWVRPTAVAAIVLLSGINYLGVRHGSLTQNALTLLKLMALAGLIGVGLWSLIGSAGVVPNSPNSDVGSFSLLAGVGAALVPVVFTYGGWHHLNHLAGEVLAPRRTLPLALAIGMGVVMSVYLLANFTYVSLLGTHGLAESLAPAAEVMNLALGPSGRQLISIGVILSTFGILNVFIMASPRVYQAMAYDDLFFQRFAQLHPYHKTPSWGILLQAVWAILLIFSGTYAQLLDYIVFGETVFLALVVATLFVYRRRDDGHSAERTFHIPAYPWLPILFILMAVYIVISTLLHHPFNALISALLIGAGVPVYLYWRK